MAEFILVYTHPTEGERRYELVPGRSYRIGSRPDNDVVIEQKDVSRRHAVLRVHEGSFHITDLDSKNGTFLNGAKTVSEAFSCGDMVHLSSARLVIIEVGTGNFPPGPDAIFRREDDSGSRHAEETQRFRSEASVEDVVSLLETTASAVRRGSLADPLGWAVSHLGFDGAVVLYRDEQDSVAMISSAWDLGGLASNVGVLSRLATNHRLTSAAGTRVRQVDEMGENLLVATVGSDHVLVVRHAGRPPAIGDLRSVIAAVSAVLAGGEGAQAGPSGDIKDFEQRPEGAEETEEDASLDALDLEALADSELAEARNAFETWMIRRALNASNGQQTGAARRLGISRAGLFKKMRKLGF